MRRKKISILLLLVVFVSLLTACTSNQKSDVETATINQVLGNRNTLQESALYHFDKGALTVRLAYASFQNPTEVAKDSSGEKIIQDDLARINQEFPVEKKVIEDLERPFEKEFKKVTLKIDKQKREVLITGEGVNKVFQMSENNDNWLIDEVGIEYELLE